MDYWCSVTCITNSEFVELFDQNLDGYLSIFMILFARRKSCKYGNLDKATIHRVAVAKQTAKSKNLALQRKLAKSKWSKEEDSLLKYLAEKENGTKNWREIALHIPGRTAIDCLHR